MNEWRPISEYNPEVGRVLVWLEWSEYSHVQQKMGRSGEAQFGYTLQAGGNAVWVEAKDCIPIETTGRRVTHFMQPQSPVKTSDKPFDGAGKDVTGCDV